MLSWSVKSKDATAHVLPTKPNTHVSPVHLVHTPSLVPDPQKNTVGTNGQGDPLSPSHDLSAERMIPKPQMPMPKKYPPNHTPDKDPHNPVRYVPADPDSDPGFSYSPLSGSYYSSDNDYYK